MSFFKRMGAHGKIRPVGLGLLSLGIAGLISAAALAAGTKTKAPVTPPPKSQQFHWIRSIYNINTPVGVDVNEAGDIYVATPLNIEIFDPQGRLLKTINRPTSKYPFVDLFQIRVDDSNDRVYAADFNSNVVWKFDENGNYRGYFPMGVNTRAQTKPYIGHTFHAYSVDYYNNRIYVGTINCIYVFTPKGKLVERIGGTGPFQFINGMAIDRQRGVIYVADTLDRRVVAMTPLGKILWTAGIPDKNGNIVSFFNLPRGIAVGPHGDVYVVDSFRDQIIVLSPQGKLLGVYGGQGAADGLFDMPNAIAIVPPPSLWQRFLDYLLHDPVVAGLGGVIGALLIWRVWRSKMIAQRKALASLLVVVAGAGAVAGFNALPGLNQGIPGGGKPLAYVADRGNNRIEIFRLGAVPPPTSEQVQHYDQGFIKGALTKGKGAMTQIPITHF